MSLSEKLTEIKNEADALINYANNKTGADDVSIGDAIKTLVDGFGGGGSDGTKIVTGTLIGDGIIHNGANSKQPAIEINLPFRPVAFEIHLRNLSQLFDVNHALSMFCIMHVAAFGTHRNANNSTLNNGGFWIATCGQAESNFIKIDYSDGVLLVYFSPASRTMIVGEPYDYTIWG